MSLTVSQHTTVTDLADSDSTEQRVQYLGGKLDLNLDPASHDKFKQAIESEAVNDRSSKEIGDLKDTVRFITRSFQKIREDLYSFDNGKYRDTDGVPIKLTPDWDVLSEHFKDILDTSRDNAIDAAAFMRQFTETILQDVEVSEYPALRDELANFVALLAKKEENAKKARKEFSELASDVHLFGTKIDQALVHAEAHLEQQLQETKNRIEDLHCRLSKISHETTELAVACITSFTTAARGVGLALATLSPDGFVLAVSSVVALTGGNSSPQFKKLLEEKKEVKQELTMCTKEAIDLGQRMSALHEYKESLESTKLEIKQLSSKITVLENIWQSLKGDFHSFSEQLNIAANPEVKITKFFQKKVANTRSLYKRLIVLLEMYANNATDKDDDETL